MLRRGNTLKGFRLAAADGEIGSVKEFYFEDDTWTVRYIVVNTGSWLMERQVLISPASVRGIDDGAQTITVGLSREQVKNGPPVSTDKPVSRRYEARYNGYYRIIPYWIGPGRWGSGEYPSLLYTPGIAATAPSEAEPGDIHLRSSNEIMKYTLQARDGNAGGVEDFIVDDKTWAVRYVVVDTKEWWPGGEVLVSPLWIDTISWARDSIFVDLPRQVVREAPRYDPAQPITEDYERRLFRYYGSEEYFNLLHLKRPTKV